jgi:ribose 5-phosphate isomerase B
LDGRRIAIGSDHAGFPLKEHLRAVLEERGCEVHDAGTTSEASCDYPDFAHAVAGRVAKGEADVGVLVCGTGVGMSITANKHQGVRAVVCSECFSAKMARAHNDANVLCMGQRVVGAGLATEILDAFLGAKFEGGRHERRVGKIEPA